MLITRSHYALRTEWAGRGLNLPRRVQHLEERWAYYLGYGWFHDSNSRTTLTSNCAFHRSSYGDPVLIREWIDEPGPICTRLFSSTHSHIAMTFLDHQPVQQFIIMAMYAHPAPLDPYNPLSSFDTPMYPSPSVPVRLPVFATVLWLNDTVVVGVEMLMRMLGLQFDASPFVSGMYSGAGRASAHRMAKREPASEEGIAFSYGVDAYAGGGPSSSTSWPTAATNAQTRFRVPGPDATRRKYA